MTLVDADPLKNTKDFFTDKLTKTSIDTCRFLAEFTVIYGAWNTLASEWSRLMPTTISSCSRPHYSELPSEGVNFKRMSCGKLPDQPNCWNMIWTERRQRWQKAKWTSGQISTCLISTKPPFLYTFPGALVKISIFSCHFHLTYFQSARIAKYITVAWCCKEREKVGKSEEQASTMGQVWSRVWGGRRTKFNTMPLSCAT